MQCEIHNKRRKTYCICLECLGTRQNSSVLLPGEQDQIGHMASHPPIFHQTWNPAQTITWLCLYTCSKTHRVCTISSPAGPGSAESRWSLLHDAQRRRLLDSEPVSASLLGCLLVHFGAESCCCLTTRKTKGLYYNHFSELYECYDLFPVYTASDQRKLCVVVLPVRLEKNKIKGGHDLLSDGGINIWQGLLSLTW